MRKTPTPSRSGGRTRRIDRAGLGCVAGVSGMNRSRRPAPQADDAWSRARARHPRHYTRSDSRKERGPGRPGAGRRLLAPPAALAVAAGAVTAAGVRAGLAALGLPTLTQPSFIDGASLVPSGALGGGG